jgi:hypothetical protein
MSPDLHLHLLCMVLAESREHAAWMRAGGSDACMPPQTPQLNCSSFLSGVPGRRGFLSPSRGMDRPKQAKQRNFFLLALSEQAREREMEREKRANGKLGNEKRAPTKRRLSISIHPAFCRTKSTTYYAEDFDNSVAR